MQWIFLRPCDLNSQETWVLVASFPWTNCVYYAEGSDHLNFLCLIFVTSDGTNNITWGFSALWSFHEGHRNFLEEKFQCLWFVLMEAWLPLWYEKWL